jgi:TfoX/Sxy family transcriptional regulator of competence genes
MAEPYLALLSDKIDRLEIQLSDTVILCKHFFSGAAAYANGKICASLTPAGLGLKLPPETREQLLQLGGGKELRYFKNAPVKKEYVVLSPDLADDPEQLKPLFIQCIIYVTETERNA